MLKVKKKLSQNKCEYNILNISIVKHVIFYNLKVYDLLMKKFILGQHFGYILKRTLLPKFLQMFVSILLVL